MFEGPTDRAGVQNDGPAGAPRLIAPCNELGNPYRHYWTSLLRLALTSVEKTAGSVPTRGAGRRVFKSIGRNVTVCKKPHWCSESFLPSGGGVEEPLCVVEELNVLVKIGRRN